MTANELLWLFRDLKFVEAFVGWLLSNVLENWGWYQRKSKADKMLWASIFTLGIGLLSTVVYYILFGGEMPMRDAIANLLYAWGASLVGSQSRHTRRKMSDD